MMKNIKTKRFLVSVIGLIVLSVFTYAILALAAPPDSPYLPGATLNPSCSPGDTNCTVSKPVSYDTTNINIPIGTTTAASLLELYSTTTAPILTITAATSTTSYDPYLAFRTGATPATKFVLGVDYSDSNKFKIATSTIGTNDIFVIDQSGNIGIGTSTPGYLLTVAGVIYSSTGGIRFPDNTTQTTAATTGTNYWTLSGSNIYPTSTSYNVGIGTTTPATLFSVATTTNIFNITSAGNIGIGTTTPATPLHLFGASNALRFSYDASNYATLSVASNGDLTITNSTTTESSVIVGSGVASQDVSLKLDGQAQDYYLGLDNSDSDKFMIGLGSAIGTTPYLTILSSGNLGLGTTTPAHALTVNGGLWVGTSTVGIPTLYVASTTGRVGIGTSTPSSLLDVAGIAQLRGFATSTTGLYVDGSGNVGIGTTTPGAKLHIS